MRGPCPIWCPAGGLAGISARRQLESLPAIDRYRASSCSRVPKDFGVYQNGGRLPRTALRAVSSIGPSSDVPLALRAVAAIPGKQTESGRCAACISRSVLGRWEASQQATHHPWAGLPLSAMASEHRSVGRTKCTASPRHIVTADQVPQRSRCSSPRCGASPSLALRR
jgi:hypothetical protein